MDSQSRHSQAGCDELRNGDSSSVWENKCVRADSGDDE